MSTKAVMMMIIMRTERSSDDCAARRRGCVDTRCPHGWDELGREPRGGLWSLVSLLSHSPNVDGVHIPATAQQCDRRNSSGIADITARSGRLLHRKVIPDRHSAHLYSFCGTLRANWSVQYECMQNISGIRPSNRNIWCYVVMSACETHISVGI